MENYLFDRAERALRDSQVLQAQLRQAQLKAHISSSQVRQSVERVKLAAVERFNKPVPRRVNGTGNNEPGEV